MRAIVVREFGPPGVLRVEEVEDPRPGEGEVVVRATAIPLLWVETMIRRGLAPPGLELRPPFVPGGAVVGEVVAAGSGAGDGMVGREVLARTAGGGGYAELVVAPAATVTPLPDGLGRREAAALAYDGATATALFERLAIGPGDRLLVVGASGGLGIVSVQLGLSRGARVVATARDDAKLARVRELGAHAVIDSDAAGWVARARAALGGDGATVVLDNVGGEAGEASFAAIAPGGRFSAHGTPSGRFAAIDPVEIERRGVTLTGIADLQLPPAERFRLGARALSEAAAGRIAPIVGQTFPLEGAADAHAAIEARTVFGTTLLEP
ncbi:MAG: zinc-binding dehydrogenase [Thermoleophilia bacterium]